MIIDTEYTPHSFIRLSVRSSVRRSVRRSVDGVSTCDNTRLPYQEGSPTTAQPLSKQADRASGPIAAHHVQRPLGVRAVHFHLAIQFFDCNTCRSLIQAFLRLPNMIQVTAGVAQCSLTHCSVFFLTTNLAFLLVSKMTDNLRGRSARPGLFLQRYSGRSAACWCSNSACLMREEVCASLQLHKA